MLTDAFRMGGPPGEARGAGPVGDAVFAARLRRSGWRAAHREDLAPLVGELRAQKAWPWAWPWPELLQPGLRYLLHALAPA